MAWVKIDEEFYDHPRWCDAPGDSIALWLAAMAWCNRNDSIQGFIPRAKTAGLVNVRNLKTTLGDLVTRGAFDPADTGFIIHDYTEYQQPERVRQIAEIRAASGRKGAAKRWQEKGKPNGNAIANAIAKHPPEKCPVPVSRNPSTTSVTQSSSSTTTPRPDDDDDTKFDHAIDLIVTAIEQDWAGRINKPRGWRATVRRNTITEDGNLIRQLIAEDTPTEHIALHVLGHGQITAIDRKASTWCTPDCADCTGEGYISQTSEDGSRYASPCPRRTT